MLFHRSRAVSAIIPNWNRADLLETVLTSLRSQTQPIDEIIVVDNASSDESVTVAKRFGARVIVLESNQGFAPAINAGIAAATGDWILLANNDVTFRADWMETLLRVAEEEQAAFATGKLLQTGGQGRIDGTWDMVSRAAYAWRCGYNRRDGELWSQRRRIWMAPMTAALFHRSVFDRVGNLDARFEAYYEDVDFGIRCTLAGIHGVYVPEAIAEHRGKSTLGKNGKKVFYFTARNQVILLAKHYSAETLRKFAWPILVGQVLSLMAAASHGHLLSALRGKWEGLRKWRVFRSGARSRKDHDVVIESALVESEREIHNYQQAIGYDPYWRIYFSLVRNG